MGRVEGFTWVEGFPYMGRDRGFTWVGEVEGSIGWEVSRILLGWGRVQGFTWMGGVDSSTWMIGVKGVIRLRSEGFTKVKRVEYFTRVGKGGGFHLGRGEGCH